MARKQSPTLTDAELRPMEVLWQRGSATVAEVVEALPERLGTCLQPTRGEMNAPAPRPSSYGSFARSFAMIGSWPRTLSHRRSADPRIREKLSEFAARNQSLPVRLAALDQLAEMRMQERLINL